jgi:hypothetical protein
MWAYSNGFGEGQHRPMGLADLMEYTQKTVGASLLAMGPSQTPLFRLQVFDSMNFPVRQAMFNPGLGLL